MFGHNGCQHLQKRCQGSTDKLKAKTIKCNAAHPTQAATLLPKQKASIIKYDVHYHCMLVALRCAVSNRPFASVEDKYYTQEVELLHHGMCICTSNTSSRLMYSWMQQPLSHHLVKPSVRISRLFMLMPGTI